MIGAVRRRWIGVDERGGQPRYCMQQIVLRVNGHMVSLDGSGVRIDHDLALGPELMTDPAQSDLADIQDTGRGPQHLLRAVDELRVNGVHQATVNLARCLPEDGEDGQGDQQPHNRIRPGKPGRDPGDPSPSATRAAEPILRPTRIR